MKSRSLEHMIPLLVQVQSNLDAELDLDLLAGQAGYSKFHFHRLFKQALGETPRAYIERLRMEKAAYKLWITSESVVDIALTVGFRNHETFCRAFRRYFRATPGELRETGRMGRRRRARPKEERSPAACVLSPVRYQVLRPMKLLAVRHVGGYSAIPEPFCQGDCLWRKIAAWTEERRIQYYPAAVCIFYDNPWLTPEASQHADACLPIGHSIKAAGRIRCLSIEEGEYGVIEHMGPPSTRWKAFRELADAIHASDKYRFPAEPTGAMSIKPLNGGELDRLEVYLKVARKT